jgi:hypothetical protein
MQSSEEKLAAQVNEIQALAKENKNIDTAALLLSALDSHSSNLVPAKQKRWAYLISIAVPPFGLLFALKYFFSDEDDARHTAYACMVLTVVSVLIVYFFSKSLFSTAGVTPQQIEQIKPSDIYQLTQ